MRLKTITISDMQSKVTSRYAAHVKVKTRQGQFIGQT